MRDHNLLEELARAAGAYTKERLPTIEQLQRDSITTSPDNQIEARQSLIVQRTNSVYYRDPTKQKRNIIRSKKEKAALLNTDNWTYTTAERYAVLDSHIRKGGSPGLAQAILSFDLNDPLDVNVAYVADNNGDAICTGKSNGWLELAAKRNERNDVAYIRLLTKFGASQASRDNALAIALDQGALETAQELFRNDANPNAIGIPDHFLSAIRDQNQRLYTMFLAARTPLNMFYVNQALLQTVGRDTDLVALLIAHGADGMSNDGEALCASIDMHAMQDTAMILINSENDFLSAILDKATNKACAITDEKTKLGFLKLLFSAGANANTPRIQDELLGAVKNEQFHLVQLLIDCETSPDHNDAESLRLAITSNRINYARVLLQGSVSTISASRALGEANVLEDLETFEEIVKAIVEKGVSQASLTKCLHDSVEKGSTLLAPMLIEKGAVLDYGNAQCVRRALDRRDFALLGKLLEGSCQPSVLGGVLPDAMKIQPPSERFEVMSQLLKKGVSGKELHIALQTLAANMNDQADYSLVEALMNHNASVDFFDRNGNCICTAAAQHNERALDLLCQGNPSPDTASSALKVLPVSFETAGAVDYEQQVGMISTLLEKGAYGAPLAEMLITAVRDDRRQKVLTALIRYRADANYDKGKAIEEALGLPGISALELICKGCKIEKSTFVSQLSNALNPAKFNNFNLDKATLLVRTSTKYGYKGVLNNPLLEEVETRGSRVEVIKLLLGFGASANFQNARALQIAISAGNIEVCRLLLAPGVEQSNIALAFPITSGIVDRGTRYELMKSLLEVGKYSIGQDQALVQACQEATPYDLAHVDLLLEYQASANFNDGAAVLASVDTNNLPLLKRLVHTGLNRRTMADTFALIRRKDFTKDERYQMLETLLGVFSDEDQASVALIEAVERDPQDIKTASLLLDHGASLETKHALAMQLVASAGSLELLNILLSKNPSQSCRDVCFNAVAASLLGNDQRLPVYRALLETGITQDVISAALFEETGLEIIDTSVLSLLIDFNASLDYDHGSAIHRVITRGDLESLNVLFRGVVSSKETLDRSFSASMELTDPHRLTIAKTLLEKEPGVNQDRVSNHLAQIVEEGDHDLLSLMMDYEPDPAYNEGESLRFCAQSGDARAAEFLARVKVSSLAVYHAFETLLNCRTIQSKPNGLQTAKVLLSMGVTQTLVDRALLDGFDAPIDQLTHNLVELLIPYSPYINGGGGKFFVDTATNGAVELFMRLASQKPDLNIVIPALIRAFKDENELLTWLTILEECTNRGLEPLQDFVIFIALTEFPTGNLLVKHLLGHGCPANSKTDSEIYEFTSAETMTLLIWALSPTTPTISEAVIMEILEDGHDAEISFESTTLHISATQLASSVGTNSVLTRLINLGVDLSQRDSNGQSALLYASKSGHLETARLLVQAGAATDDGSLHEAGRGAYPRIIELLLENGHRADYPSAIHADQQFGRTALEELCLKATSGSDGWQKRIQQSIKLLLPTNVRDIAQSGGETMLHLALKNADGVAVTRELLAFPAVWKNINDTIYLYQDEQGYFYSLTKYAELLFKASNPEKCKQLLTLLRAVKCKDRLYAHTVDQPEGAVGLPDEVFEAVNKQKRADHEQREELKRLEAITARRRSIEAEDWERTIRITKEKHSLLMRQVKEQENTDKQIAQNKQAMALKYTQELQREIQDALLVENRIKLKGVDEVGAKKIAHAKAEQSAELAHRKALDQREQAAAAAKLDYERTLISAREIASRNDYKRQTDLCDYKDASARYQAQQRAQYSNV